MEINKMTGLIGEAVSLGINADYYTEGLGRYCGAIYRMTSAVYILIWFLFVF